MFQKIFFENYEFFFVTKFMFRKIFYRDIFKKIFFNSCLIIDVGVLIVLVLLMERSRKFLHFFMYPSLHLGPWIHLFLFFHSFLTLLYI